MLCFLLVRETIEQGFRFNDEANGISVSMQKHSGSHPEYMKKITQWNSEIKGANKGATSKEILKKVVEKGNKYIEKIVKLK